MFKTCMTILIIALIVCIVFDLVTRHFWLLISDSLMVLAVMCIIWAGRKLVQLNKVR